MSVRSNIVLENIEGKRIGFRNFAGETGPYNPAGKRTFCIFFDSEEESLVNRLADDGWVIKYTKPREDGDEPRAFLTVAVSFDHIPPKIVLITGGGKTILSEADIHQLDSAIITSADIVISPYNWTFNGKTGVKAYLKTMYVTLEKDEFEDKYTNVPFDNDAEEDF